MGAKSPKGLVTKICIPVSRRSSLVGGSFRSVPKRVAPINSFPRCGDSEGSNSIPYLVAKVFILLEILFLISSFGASATGETFSSS